MRAAEAGHCEIIKFLLTTTPGDIVNQINKVGER